MGPAARAVGQAGRSKGSHKGGRGGHNCVLLKQTAVAAHGVGTRHSVRQAVGVAVLHVGVGAAAALVRLVSSVLFRGNETALDAGADLSVRAARLL